MAGPRNYTPMTLKRLFARSGNQCAFRECDKLLVDTNNAVNSNICHIEAASPGGQRYNPDMSDEQRADYDNLILLCPTHHRATDDMSLYTVEVIKEMKREHEAQIQRRLCDKRPLNSRPSLLADVVRQICRLDIDCIDSLPVSHGFSIEEKLDYNQVKRNRPIVHEFAAYQGKLNKIYAEFERAGNKHMNSTLRNISSLYQRTKGDILAPDLSIENIRKHSDRLLDTVEHRLHELLEQSPNNDPTLSFEDVDFAIRIIVVDAFMRCKLLEKPR